MAKGAPRAVPNVLIVAGIDPSGGAGLLADIKTAGALGAYGCGVPTAITVQNTIGVSRTEPVSPGLVGEQLEAVLSDVPVDSVKIGMLGNAGVVDAVAGALEKYAPPFVVLDPVLASTSGAPLLDPEGVREMKKRLFPLCSCITPNLPEAALLLGAGRVAGEAEMPETSRKLWREAGGRGAIYLKGGHLSGNDLVDVAFDGLETRFFRSGRIDTRSTHGTGCALSTAIAALAPASQTVWDAFDGAHRYLNGAIRNAWRLQAGSGRGPVDHFWNWR